jgi:hypothetical protein
VRGHRQQLGLARIHVRRERRERFAQVLNRSLVSCPSCAYAKGECNNKNKPTNHISKSARLSEFDFFGRGEIGRSRLEDGWELVAMGPEEEE